MCIRDRHLGDTLGLFPFTREWKKDDRTLEVCPVGRQRVRRKGSIRGKAAAAEEYVVGDHPLLRTLLTALQIHAFNSSTTHTK